MFFEQEGCNCKVYIYIYITRLPFTNIHKTFAKSESKEKRMDRLRFRENGEERELDIDSMALRCL